MRSGKKNTFLPFFNITFFPYILRTAWATKKLFISFNISFWRAFSLKRNFSKPMTKSAEFSYKEKSFKIFQNGVFLQIARACLSFEYFKRPAFPGSKQLSNVTSCLFFKHILQAMYIFAYEKINQYKPPSIRSRTLLTK